MGNKPYAKPLGIHTAIGRAWLSVFGRNCQGDRLMNGEHVYRTGKVVDAHITNELMDGFFVQAHVLSQDARKCEQRFHGRYETEIRVHPFTTSERSRALITLRKMGLWRNLVQSGRPS